MSKIRIVVAFNEEAVNYANKHGFNKALRLSKEKECSYWDVEEFSFKSKDEAKSFLKGLSLITKWNVDEPAWKEVRKSPKKKKKK